MSDLMSQWAEYPETLEWLVLHCDYRPGWTVEFVDDLDRGQGSRGATIVITTNTVNSYNHKQPMNVHHYFPVPPAAFDERSWRRWLFERFHQVELHECMEFFTIDGEKPYAPSHGPGNDPYMIREVGTDEDVRTSFRGELKQV